MNDDILISLHRGDTQRFCANSFAAIQATWSLGFMPEVDVRLTKDNILVLAHDDGIRDICQGAPRLNISQLTYKELATHPLCSGDAVSQPIPQLSTIIEQMRLTKSRRVLLDVKIEEAYPVIFQSVGNAEVASQTHFLVNSVDQARMIKKALPTASVHLLFRHWSKLIEKSLKDPSISSIVYTSAGGLIDKTISRPQDAGFKHLCDLAKKHKKRFGVVMLDPSIDKTLMRDLKKVGVTFFGLVSHKSCFDK